jgi:phenylacetate-coenzyme A ligase PaaK-like adenylate-forming protein
MTEMGYGGGVECQAHVGYHMREADLFFEIVDPLTGKRVERGKSGEVVFTSLTRRGMPLLRYRTGDISRFIPERCPCGTLLESMEPIEGRIEGKIRLGDMELSMADLDEALFPLAGLLDFSAELHREDYRDRLHIDIHAMEAHGGRMERLARSALEKIPALWDALEANSLYFSVSVRTEGQFTLDSLGKRRVVDRRFTDSGA